MTELLINLYGVETTEEEEPSVVDPPALWPISDLRTVVARSDLKNVKKQRPKRRAAARLDDVKFSPSTDCVDGQIQERCCRPEDEEEESFPVSRTTYEETKGSLSAPSSHECLMEFDVRWRESERPRARIPSPTYAGNGRSRNESEISKRNIF